MPGGFNLLGWFAKVEADLGFVSHGVVLAQQHGVEQGLGELAFVVGHGHQHAQFFANAFGLAQNHLQHGAIDGVVFAVKHGAAHFLGLLAEAVHAAFALLVAGGVPAQVVMHHGGEQALQVDAFGEAVGGHQDALLCIPQLGHSGFALAGGEFTGDRLDCGLFELTP